MRRFAVVMCVALLAMAMTSCDWLFPGIDPTPNPDPNPAPGATLFFDDFADGLEPEWNVTTGWEVGAGMLIHKTSDAWAYVGHGSDWRDYRVDVDIEPRNEDVGIIVRCQEDMQSYVLVYGDTDRLKCKIYLNGDDIEDTGWSSPGFFDGEQSAQIRVEGTTLRFYLNGNLRLTVEDIPFLSGMPGLYSYGYSSSESEARFDNFRVTDLD